ncbi:hypothetical protein ABIB94_007048 [Bradyrhizobium sp. JR7.2]|uniref:hypothetical protein n=1 Tax=Bradyrhizobium sp. JR7.2 TaxID=3156375 RepID=UPI003395F452
MPVTPQSLRNTADFMQKASGVDPTWLRETADELEKLRRRVAVLEMVIQEELDEFDCCDEANRTIVENIHERGASVALPSNQCGGK